MTYHTAYDWFRKGKMPVPAYQTPTGTIIVEAPDEHVDGECVVYARVSSADQKDGLDGQVARLTAWMTSQGLSVDRVVTEVGSALNGSRRKFQGLLADRDVSVIVVEHRDRAVRVRLSASVAVGSRPPGRGDERHGTRR